MAIVKTGAFFEDSQTFTYGFSDGSGRLEVTDGDILTLSATSGIGPFLSAGRPGSGAPDPTAIGTILLRDPGTILDVISAGSATDGASLAIARGDDTRGLMQIENGAMFRLTDPTGPDNSDPTGGVESGWIGRGARADGRLELRAGDFIFSGTGSNLSVGHDGGTGTISLADGSGFVMETTSAGAEDFTHLRIGLNGGTGDMEIDRSFALVQAGLNASALVDVGRGGTGTLTIDADPDDLRRDGLFIVGNAYSPFAELAVGALGGSGEALITGGTLGVVNTGVEVFRDGGFERRDADGFLGGSAALLTGVNGGEGDLSAAEKALVFIGGSNFATALIGVGEGALGTMSLSDSRMEVISFDREAGLQIGEWEGESRGRLTLRDAAEVEVTGPQWAYASLGRWEGSQGTLVIESGSTLSLASENGGASVNLGWDGGEGDITLSGVDTRIDLAAPETFFFVGRNGGDGRVTAGSGAEIALEAQTFVTDLGIGVGGGTGEMTLDGANLTARSLNDKVRLMVGEWEGGGADGLLILRNGASALFEGAGGTFANIGGWAGNEGRLQIEGGATLELTSGADWGASLDLGRDAAEGSALVTGADSQLRVQGLLIVGHDDGTGTLDIAAGGAVRNIHDGFTQTHIGYGSGATGTVSMDNGSLLTRSDMDTARFEIGAQGATGTLSVTQGSSLQVISGARNADFDLGYAGGTGTLNVTDSQFDLFAPLRDASDTPRDTNAWMLVGTEGGTGLATFDNADVNLAAGQGGGFRIGTRWTNTEDNSGDGRVILQNGSVVYAEVLQQVTNFWVGGGEGSYGEARILSGSVLDLSGNGWVPVGFATSDMTGGGAGFLQIDGAGSRLTGVRYMTVGARGSEGVVQISNTAQALIGAEDTAEGVFVTIGTYGGTGQATLSSGARMVMTATEAELGIGVNGGAGQFDILGAGTELVVGGPEGRIHIGRERDADTTGDGPARGILRIGEGAQVQVQARVEIGDSTAHSALLAMEGGQLSTPLVELHAGPDQMNNMLIGYGTILGVANQPALLLGGASVFVGDTLGTETPGAATRVTATGQLDITGNVAAQDSLFAFDIGAANHDQIIVSSGSFTMDGGIFRVTPGENAEAHWGAGGLRLLSASGGIVLNDVVLDLGALSSGTGYATELRAGGTELWAVLDEGSGEQMVRLSGQLRLVPDAGAGDTQITFTPEGDETSQIRSPDLEGAFRFDLRAGSSGTLSVTRSYDPATDPSVTALDALDVLRLAVGLAPSWGTASALNFIAADIDQSGQVTALDALEVLRAAVGLNSDHPLRWIFLDEDTDLSAISSSNTQIDTSLTFSDLAADPGEISMVGILLGNMQEMA